MKVLFISQCSKKATLETRRILDQFSERKGACAWETNITLQGLETVKKLLKMTARRNTAVACHLLKGRLKSQLLWIVGNSKLFNEKGNIPTNVTRRNILRSEDENGWETGEAVSILSSLAGLFHDFGKANLLFQSKLLKEKGAKTYEPFRHEWMSLLLFKTLVGNKTDEEWLKYLSEITPEKESEILEEFQSDTKAMQKNPLIDLPQVAKIIGWLILSHHRLPVPKDFSTIPIDKIDEWMDHKKIFSAKWNSYSLTEDWSQDEWKRLISFEKGTPIRSEAWCNSANLKSSLALKYFSLVNKDWFSDLFSMHLMRATLMLADHSYSSEISKGEFQDKSYNAYANTKFGKLDQKLDQHNIQVSRYAYYISKTLPILKKHLPSLSSRLPSFKKRTKISFFS